VVVRLPTWRSTTSLSAGGSFTDGDGKSHRTPLQPDPDCHVTIDLLDSKDENPEDGGVSTGEDYVCDKPSPSRPSPYAGVPVSAFVGMDATNIRLLAQAKSPLLRRSAAYAVPDAAIAIYESAVD
jgi:hypothetical protein